MELFVPESTYPLYFRADAIKLLAEHLAKRHSVELIGMKRVGINNFLRFFLFNKQIQKKYLSPKKKDVFILVDLNDLIERELFPFWRLTLKRIVDAVEQSTLSDEIKEKVSQLFVSSIQSGDSFLTYDGVREALVAISHEASPTIFFTRFDRLHDTVTPEFFNNLESLKDATNQKLAYVFTSFRELDAMAPSAFFKKSFYGFSHVIYLPPATYQDIDVMLITFLEQYDLKLTRPMIQTIIDLSGGHAQYMQLLLIILDELHKKQKTVTEDAFREAVTSDERSMLLSEELWENLTAIEQDVLQKIVTKKKISMEEKEKARYVWDTGISRKQQSQYGIFSPLFADFIEKKGQTKENGAMDLSKKEHILFTLLKEHVNTICEREKIVEIVWPEYKTYGVSDWSIDRLVARVRGKLKKQKSPYEIVTVRTRGYKLTTTV